MNQGFSSPATFCVPSQRCGPRGVSGIFDDHAGSARSADTQRQSVRSTKPSSAAAPLIDLVVRIASATLATHASPSVGNFASTEARWSHGGMDSGAVVGGGVVLRGAIEGRFAVHGGCRCSR